MNGQVRVDGAQELAQTTRAAAQGIRDLNKPNQAAGRLIITASRSGVPIRTGRLAASVALTVTDTEVTIGSNLIYAPVIHNGWPAHHIKARPWLAQAAEANQDRVIDTYADHVTTQLDRIQGA